MQKINWILPTINGICKIQCEWIILQQNCTYHTRSTSPPCLAISALTLFANLTASSFSILVMGGRYHTSQTTENIKEIYDNLYHPNIIMVQDQGGHHVLWILELWVESRDWTHLKWRLFLFELRERALILSDFRVGGGLKWPKNQLTFWISHFKNDSEN